MTILITGASGAVGVPTIRHLVKRGAKVRALTSKEASAANLKSLGVSETVLGDLTSDADVRRAMRGVASVMHIPPRFREDEAEIGMCVLKAAQAEKVMDNVRAVLEAAGVGVDHIVKTTIFLVDMRAFAEVNTVYERKLNGHKPARSTVAVAALPKGALVEVEVLAVR